jgi:hypothetical protein
MVAGFIRFLKVVSKIDTIETQEKAAGHFLENNFSETTARTAFFSNHRGHGVTQSYICTLVTYAEFYLPAARRTQSLLQRSLVMI